MRYNGGMTTTYNRTRVHSTTRIDDADFFEVVATDKESRESYVARTYATFEDADDYVQRNESPDNYERYHVVKVKAVER